MQPESVVGMTNTVSRVHCYSIKGFPVIDQGELKKEGANTFRAALWM